VFSRIELDSGPHLKEVPLSGREKQRAMKEGNWTTLQPTQSKFYTRPCLLCVGFYPDYKVLQVFKSIKII